MSTTDGTDSFQMSTRKASSDKSVGDLSLLCQKRVQEEGGHSVSLWWLVCLATDDKPSLTAAAKRTVIPKMLGLYKCKDIHPCVVVII